MKTLISDIDRTKFSRSAWYIVSWNKHARKWFCMVSASRDDDTVIASGEGDDPMEAMIAACTEQGALTTQEVGEH